MTIVDEHREVVLCLSEVEGSQLDTPQMAGLVGFERSIVRVRC